MLNQKKEVQLDMLMPIIREKLNMGAEVELIASGNSMFPLLRHRKDAYWLTQVSGEDVKKYDMILYQRDDGKYVLHRVVGKGTEGYILRGDNQYENEYPVRPDQVIGKICRFSKNGKQMTCENLWYRVYAVVWVNTVSVRRAFPTLQRLVYRVLRKVYQIFIKGEK